MEGRFIMKAVACLLVLMLFVTAGSALGKAPHQGEEEMKAAVERSLGQILDLWRDGRYEELYERTLAGGSQSREAFMARLSSATYRPACCWEKLREVRVIMKSEDQAIIRAKIGLEGGTGSSATTRDLKLTREDGAWRIARGDLLALAGAAKKKASRSKKKSGYNQ